MNRQVFSFAAFFCWSLWKARNALYFDHATVDPLRASSPVNTLWRPPPDGYLKLNSDVTLHQSNKGNGVGFVFREANGKPLLAVSAPLFFSTPLMGEALALRMGLSAVVAHRFCFSVAESDNLALIRMLQEDTTEANVFIRPIVCDILALAAQCNSVIFFSHSKVSQHGGTYVGQECYNNILPLKKK
ncbi:hypothetical protein NE237_026326 [Protea cynaroides]|uniref:RNase H type-1 domain-containing protein n=1 Tax=Protea cynaroides TaxID=273540 RepID=A0A9Q0H6W4_9MAGN|nr:hypothetical protein NE237_026326 [Protea cynaroides]